MIFKIKNFKKLIEIILIIKNELDKLLEENNYQLIQDFILMRILNLNSIKT